MQLKYLLVLLAWMAGLAGSHCLLAAENYFEIQVVDEETGRGVPLVEMKTVNHLQFLTDSAGRVAIDEPGLLGQEVYFEVRSHGYEYAKDGFGFAGARIQLEPGGRKELRIRRLNVAERLYRITGEGIYRDSVLLGATIPLAKPVKNAGVVGQDSTQAAVYQGRIHWTWGDTSLSRYPLGNFRSAGATSLLPNGGGLAPDVGIDLNYFCDDKGFSRPVCPLEKNEGVVWLDGMVVVPDEAGRDRLVVHYARMKSLGTMLEHGIAIWNDEQNIFERAVRLENEEKWRFPHTHPFRSREDGQEYVYCGDAMPNVRVPAKLAALLDPTKYEALSCIATESIERDSPEKSGEPARDAKKNISWGWRRDVRPTKPADEQRWLAAGTVRPEELRLLPQDVEGDKRIQLHGGSVRWNPYRQRFVLIAVEIFGRSMLGEVWYSEAEKPTGPWLDARRIVTHDKYSFYNPVHHDFFDQEGARIIYFEGTYAHTFSGRTEPTPRYDYNQIMYRLDLDDPHLEAVRQ